MTVPTKELLKNRQVVGYEICNNPFCDWKNVFFEGKDHRAELIAALGIFGSFLCPKCRSEEYHASRHMYALSIGSYAEVFPDEFASIDSKVKEEPVTPPDMRSMGVRQHARAVVRCFFPWGEEIQSWFAAVSMMFLPLMFFFFINGNKDDFWFLVGFFELVVIACLGWHLLFGILALLMLIPKKSRQKEWWSTLRFWKELGERPLFPIYTERRKQRRYSYKYFRSEGMSRKKARRLSGRHY